MRGRNDLQQYSDYLQEVEQRILEKWGKCAIVLGTKMGNIQVLVMRIWEHKTGTKQSSETMNTIKTGPEPMIVQKQTDRKTD